MLRDHTLQTLHRPGHSPSDTLFWDARRRIAIAGDHLLANISSNPLVSRPLDGSAWEPRPQALVSYIESLRTTRELTRGAGPGRTRATDHGPRHADRRTAAAARPPGGKINGLLEEGPLTAYEIALKMWGNVAVTQAYLTLSEVLGHLDLLVGEGRAREHGTMARAAMRRSRRGMRPPLRSWERGAPLRSGETVAVWHSYSPSDIVVRSVRCHWAGSPVGRTRSCTPTGHAAPWVTPSRTRRPAWRDVQQELWDGPEEVLCRMGRDRRQCAARPVEELNPRVADRACRSAGRYCEGRSPARRARSAPSPPRNDSDRSAAGMAAVRCWSPVVVVAVIGAAASRGGCRACSPSLWWSPAGPLEVDVVLAVGRRRCRTRLTSSATGDRRDDRAFVSSQRFSRTARSLLHGQSSQSPCHYLRDGSTTHHPRANAARAPIVMALDRCRRGGARSLSSPRRWRSM